VVLAVFGLTASNMWAALVAMFLLGAIGFATAPGLQLRIMQVAGDAPTMASGANVAALNVGNAFGAWLGGMAIAAGFGFVSPLWVGAGLALAAALVLATAIATKAKDPAPGLTSAPVDAAIEPAPAEPVAAERA
jgi:DHA1 family inner membrane transport protein